MTNSTENIKTVIKFVLALRSAMSSQNLLSNNRCVLDKEMTN